MVLDVGLGLEQHQRLHDEALDQLDSPVLTQRQDLLVGEQVSGSLHMTQPLPPRVLERTRPKQFAGDGMTSRFIDAAFELRPAPIASDRRPESRSRSSSCRPRGAPFCMLLVMVLNLPSLVGFARQRYAERAIRHHGRRCREPAGDVRRSRCTGPAVASSGPRSPTRSAFAPSVAFGLGLRVLAAGPAHFLTVLRSRRLCERARELNKPGSWKLRRGGGTRRRCWTPAAGVA